MRTIRTPENKLAFLAALAELGNVREACEFAKIGRNAAYLWKRDDPDFSAEWEAAVDAGGDSLEEEAIRRARDGVDEPVWYKGVMCGTVRKYSDTLLIFLLKGAKPEKYREQYSAPPTAHANLSPEEIEAKIAELTKA